MTASDSALPVLIIGAGLGGLTLANSLKKYNIPYHIFERDSEAGQRAQGYRVSIDGGSGGAGLQAALSPELFEDFRKSAGEAMPIGGRLDARSGRMVSKGVMGFIGAGGWWTVMHLDWRLVWKRWERFRAAGTAAWLLSWIFPPKRPLAVPHHDAEYKIDRRITRAILLTDQSQHITYSAAFESYTIEAPSKYSSGSVTAHFADGSSARGSLLVGSDGVRSKVASQLLGAKLRITLDLGARVVYGKTPITSELEAAIHPVLRQGCNFVTDVVGGEKVLLVIEPMRFHHSRSEDYIFWALAARPGAFIAAMESQSAQFTDDELLASQGAAAAEIAISVTSHWDPRIRIVFEQQDTTQSATLKLTSSDPAGTPIWDTEPRVTLIGDAIHSMPPTGGQGANSAMRDGAVLGKALGESQEWMRRTEKFGGWTKQTLRMYEDEMRYLIGDIVGLACVAAQGMVGASVPD